MIDYEHIRKVVASGLKKYLNCPVIRSNQNKEPPAYPFISYTITTLAGENKGTYGECADGTQFKTVPQIWSITSNSNDNSESVMLISKAREWLDNIGTVYLNDNGVVCQSVGSITNRDNILTVEYEYRNGFDVVFAIADVISGDKIDNGEIETFELGVEEQR